MTIGELIPWLNLLLLPTVGLLMSIREKLAALDVTTREHSRRLDRHDSDLAELRA